MPVTSARRKCPESRSGLLVLIPVTLWPGPTCGEAVSLGPRCGADFLGGPGQALVHPGTVR